MRMPRLPPVDISPHTRLRARFCPAVNCSVATFFQSHSSSSTTSWARPVSVPCPISERAIRITQVSLGFTNTQALISAPAAAAACAAALRSEEHTSELQSQSNLVCRLLLEKKKRNTSCRLRYNLSHILRASETI